MTRARGVTAWGPLLGAGVPHLVGASLALTGALFVVAACEQAPSMDFPTREDDKPVAAPKNARGAYAFDGGVARITEPAESPEKQRQPSLGPDGRGQARGAQPDADVPAPQDAGTRPVPGDVLSEEPVAL